MASSSTRLVEAEWLAHNLSDGEEITQIWNFYFLVFAYLIASVASYSAVHLLDHGLWRPEIMKQNAIIKHPDVVAACFLAFGAVWAMHFVGMSAVALEGAPMCFDWPMTAGSLVAVVVLMVAGIKVAGNDIFATSKRSNVLRGILGNKYMSDSEALWAITKIVTFHQLQYLAAGSFLAASGAILMHYTGMMAQTGPFREKWNIGYIAISIVTGIVICFAGFWIIFRLRWKIKQFWLRYVSAAVIAAAICFLHFFGMLAASYYADLTKLDTCKRTWDQSNESPSAWTSQQLMNLALGILVPSIALYIENLISQELVLATDLTSSSGESAVMVSRFADDKTKLRDFLSSEFKEVGYDDDEDNILLESKPIADLFPESTILCANITGFTAWSSMREPSQVFTLLETAYQNFDKIMRYHRVIKVETVGDAYVAVAGVPDPREDHAEVMCKVAQALVAKMTVLTNSLERVLGPDTTDLNIRIGLHSGPITAGILRGNRNRFQLFGDTMNVATRIESSGLPGQIHISSETAEQLKAIGRKRWIVPRDDELFIKGKGSVRTHWLKSRSLAAPAHAADAKEDEGTGTGTGTGLSLGSIGLAGDEYYRLGSDKTENLIDWNVENLVGLLREIVARRMVLNGKEKNGACHLKEDHEFKKPDETVIDEVREIIDLPPVEMDPKLTKHQVDPDSIVIPEKVVAQLKDYVTCLANLYHNNPFHNFEHASHVAMSVSKLLSRIVAYSSDVKDANKSVALALHEKTFGITSDPLTQFACILSALMHDADHLGVPNGQLVKEGLDIASYYKNQSVAEQNSVDLAWAHLMDDKYADLRSTIYEGENELRRFRQLIVNSVMATDIMDKDLKKLRNDRWEKAFYGQDVNEDHHTTTNRKATIVIEHLIQASDVSHTMQHWHIFRKWNACLFEEMYKAYKEGRAEKDPSEFWYKGEIGFFDFYIIPLAKKLKDCGVFGVSSDEYLNYALQNRREWEACGEKVVEEMVEKVNKVWAEIEGSASSRGLLELEE